MAREKQDRSSVVRAVGKGFYIALALCVMAVGGLAVSTFTDTMRTTTNHSAFTTAPSAPTTTAAPVVVTPATTNAVTTTAATTSPTAATTAASTPLFCKPIDGEVTATFSETPIYSETMEDYRVHLGVDLEGEEGDTICALAQGTVTAYEEDALWGGTVTVEHGSGMASVYRGVDATVREGDVVKAGDPLGRLIGVPCERANGCHLHLELLRDGTAVDPSTVLGAM